MSVTMKFISCVLVKFHFVTNMHIKFYNIPIKINSTNTLHIASLALLSTISVR